MTEKIKTIGESKSIFVGRIMDSTKSCFGVLGDLSADRRARLPVSLRNRLALPSKMAGEYVSR
jgi:hypothetical protein